MAHVQEKYSGLWRPQDLTVDKINSQKMFIDNQEMLEAFALQTLQNVHQSVRTLDELRAIDTSDAVLFKTGMLIMVYGYGIYYFDRDSTAIVSNAVIAPITGVGRWITTTATDIAMSPIYVDTANDLDLLLTNTLAQMSDRSIKFIVVHGLNDYTPLYGNAGHITIYKNSNSYATATLITYRTDWIARVCTKVMFEGKWGRWIMLPYLDETGKIPVSQLPATYVANATVIDESEITNLEVE